MHITAWPNTAIESQPDARCCARGMCSRALIKCMCLIGMAFYEPRPWHQHLADRKYKVGDTKKKDEKEMSASVQQTLNGLAVNIEKRRKSYTREFKLEVVKFYHENNMYQTAKRFSLNTRMIGHWITDEDQIKKSWKVLKCVTNTRKCQFLNLRNTSIATTS